MTGERSDQRQIPIWCNKIDSLESIFWLTAFSNYLFWAGRDKWWVISQAWLYCVSGLSHNAQGDIRGRLKYVGQTEEPQLKQVQTGSPYLQVVLAEQSCLGPEFLLLSNAIVRGNITWPHCLAVSVAPVALVKPVPCHCKTWGFSCPAGLASTSTFPFTYLLYFCSLGQSKERGEERWSAFHDHKCRWEAKCLNVYHMTKRALQWP